MNSNLAIQADPAPLIYNLFPLLVGGFDRWRPHLERAQAMGFDWLYFNPVSYPGFSGSMYAVKEHRGFHPVLWGDDWQAGAAAFADAVATMTGLGLKPMMDLVINHTAIDCTLIKTNPTWFAHGADGKIVHPGAKDGNKMVYWGDLAQVDNALSPDRDALWAFWDELIAHHQGLGVKGFRCDAAYHVPADLWRHLIDAAKGRDPQARFFAETLGCEIEDIIALEAAGFDYIFNSAKWWDFKAPWLLDQYAKSRTVAPSIAFAESHDSERLAKECHGKPGPILARYAFAALFSTGLMMPMGFEFGATRQLNVVRTRPDHLTLPPDSPLDLTIPIGQLNHFKGHHPVFHQEGPWRILEGSAPRGATFMVKGDLSQQDAGLLSITRKLNHTAPDPPAEFAHWREVTPQALLDHDAPLRVFVPG